MSPSTGEELRETLRDWPLADLRRAIRAGLPELDDGLVALIADWLARAHYLSRAAALPMHSRTRSARRWSVRPFH